MERLWSATAASDDLYVRDHEGLYCVGCEQFYRQDELLDGRCPEHGTEPEIVSERNWFFRVSRYSEPLLAAIEEGRLRIEPEARRNEVVSFIGAGLEDISVSRSAERAHGWGIPVPGDRTAVIRVYGAQSCSGPGDVERLRNRSFTPRAVDPCGTGLRPGPILIRDALLMRFGGSCPADIGTVS